MKRSKKLMFLLFALTTMLMFSTAGTALAAGDPDFDTPLGALGPVPVPPDNPSGKNVWPSKMDAAQELGYLTFFDPKFTGDQGPSACSDCHNPLQGWGTNEPQSKGYPGTAHWRNSQTVVNNAYLQKLFWGGSSPSLEAQAPSAAKAGRAGNVERDMAEARARMTPEYVKRFNDVYGARWPLVRDVWRSMASFERYLSQTDTPFDKYARGDSNALSASAKRGLELFKGKANCFECHNSPMFTDEKYYNLGVPRAEGLLEEPLRQINLRWELYGNKGNAEYIYRGFKDDAGMWFRDKQFSSRGKFRTAPLRYLKYTAPYMHHGQFFTLREVIEFYNKGGDQNEFTSSKKYPGNPCGKPGTKTPILKKLNLTDAEMKDLEAFLLSLSGEEMFLKTPAIPKMQAVADWQPVK